LSLFDRSGDGSEDDGTLFSLASEYLEAAIVLHSTPPVRINYSLVAYYLLGHSAELMLKSYLFDHGETAASLKTVGHNLSKLIQRSRKHGLAIPLTSIKALSPVYLEKGLEYRKKKEQIFPNQEDLIAEIQALQSKVLDKILRWCNAQPTIIATDIHGVTAELRSMIEPFISGAIFLSPWDTETCPFTNEHEAVSAFISKNGIESYAEKISATANHEPAFIVGFSVGASAAWLHSASINCNPNSAATLFYGSRIRDYSSLVPKINITAIFAETEPSFSPDQIARVIARDNVRTFIEPGTFHGFMNPRSANFAASQCAVHLQMLAVELERFHFHLAQR